MCVPIKEIAPPWAAGPTHRGNTCGEWETMTAKISAHLGECKGGYPPFAPFGPGPFREKGLAPPAQGRPPLGKISINKYQNDYASSFRSPSLIQPILRKTRPRAQLSTAGSTRQMRIIPAQSQGVMALFTPLATSDTHPA